MTSEEGVRPSLRCTVRFTIDKRRDATMIRFRAGLPRPYEGSTSQLGPRTIYLWLTTDFLPHLKPTARTRPQS